MKIENLIYPYVDESNILWLDEQLPVDRFVEVKWHGMNRKHYESKGYVYTKRGNSFWVDVRDLPDGSHVRVNVYCPVDMKPREVEWKWVLKTSHGVCHFHSVSRDMRGRLFGNLVALEIIDKDKWGNYIWECKCINCGDYINVTQANLQSENTQSCGKAMCHPDFNDLTDMEFGNLTAKRIVGTNKWGSYIWECECICGNLHNVVTCELQRGNTQSCGKGGFCHPKWKGGAIDYYGPNWEEQRQRRRELDGHVCQRCSKTRVENGQELSVHHIVKFRSFGYIRDENDYYIEANDIHNLVSLCQVCHPIVEKDYNRLFDFYEN